MLLQPNNPDKGEVLVVQVSRFQPRNATTYSEAAEYWKGLASGANFLGRDLRQCLAVIHDDIVEIWNFPSLPMVRRHGPSLISRLIIRFSYLMRVSEGKCPSWWLILPTRKGLRRMTICKCLCASSYYLFAHFCPAQPRIQNTTNVAGAATAIAVIAAGAANPVGFIVGPIVGVAVFAKWVYDVYKAT